MNLDLASLPNSQSISKEQALLLFRQQEEKYQSQIDYLEEQLRLLRNELLNCSVARAKNLPGKIAIRSRFLTNCLKFPTMLWPKQWMIPLSSRPTAAESAGASPCPSIYRGWMSFMTLLTMKKFAPAAM